MEDDADQGHDELVERILGMPVSQHPQVLGALRWEWWMQQAHDAQKPPEGDWRVWYLQGGRGGGKTRTGSETLGRWITEYGPGDWGIVAPTYGDARDVCAEGPSGVLQVLGPLVVPGPRGWNRSIGEINLLDGSRIYLDGADDGALRIQGKNLRGLWADEVGLWKKWELAWLESIAFAVRQAPARIVATGTPKMGHGLVRLLVEDDTVPVSHLKTVDNIENLDPGAVHELQQRFGGTRLGAQELDGMWISELEGDVLKRSWWRFYDQRLLGTARNPGVQTAKLPRFTMILQSVDTPLKDKESSDNMAAQVWGVAGASRYLLDSRVDKLSYEQAKRAIREQALWARKTWPGAMHRVLIENAGYGVELLVELGRDGLTGVTKENPGAEGNKGMRALAASGELESGNVYVPGVQKADLTGPDERLTPKWVLALIDEAARFQLDGSHRSHDDQVDAFSQAMNWLRRRSAAPIRTVSLLRRASRTVIPAR